jgi:hypothetical protein
MPTTHPGLSRREALTRVAAAAAGIAAGCTPVRYALRIYPAAFDDQAVCDRVLRAFVLAAVPGAMVSPQSLLTRCFEDDLFPFRAYRKNFAADLCRRGGNRFGEPRFDRLDRHEQVEIVREGLRADSITRKLYAGAVFLAQVAVLGGIYADDAAVPAFDFEGEYLPHDPEDLTYPRPGRFLARGTTLDGNPV